MFGEEIRTVDSDNDQEPTLSEKRRHHHRQNGQDDAIHNQKHETAQPERHHVHHHLHGQTSSDNLEEKGDSRESDQESDHNRRYHRRHRDGIVNMKRTKIKDMRHHSDMETTHDIDENDEEIENSHQDNENENDSGYHNHYLRKENMADENINRIHHRSRAHDTSYDSNEKNDADEEEYSSRRHRGSDKHIEDDREDEDNELSSRHNSRKETQKKYDKMDDFENNEDDEDRDDVMKRKHKEGIRHRIGGNNQDNDDEMERSRTGRKMSKFHQDEDNEGDDSMNGDDIMEFGDKHQKNDEKVHEKKFHGKHVKVDNQPERSEDEDSDHELRKDDDDDDDDDVNINKKHRENEESFTKNKHRNEDLSEMSKKERGRHHKDHRQLRKESLSSESRMTNKEIHDESDDEESSKKLKHKSNDRETDRDSYDKDFQVGSKEKKKGGYERDEQMDGDKMEDGENIHHRKEENEMADYNHNHHHNYHHDNEDDIQANFHENHHHKHRHNDNDHTEEYMKEKTGQYHPQHHHHENQNENTKRNEKEQEEINRDSDMNEMESRDNKVSGDKMSKHYHHHHHHEKKTEGNDKEMNENKHRNHNEEYLDNDNIMSQNHEPNHLDESHSHNHETSGKNHDYIRNEKKSNIDEDDRNLKSSKKKAKHHDTSNKENHESSKNGEEIENASEKKKVINREKEKMDRGDDDENSEDNEGERNTIRNREGDRTEPKSKVHLHHQVDKGNDEDDTIKDNVEDEKDKTGKKKAEDSITKKGKARTSKDKQDYDEINDDDAKDDSQKKSKGDQSENITDENQSLEEHKDKSKAQTGHDAKERESDLREENKKDHESSKEKNTERIHEERKHNEHHKEKERNNQDSQSKERKREQEFAEESSKNTEHRHHKLGISSEVKSDDKNVKHRQQTISHGEMKDTKSNTRDQLKPKSNSHEISKVDQEDRNKDTDDRNSEDNTNNAKHKHNYNSKDGKRHKYSLRKGEGHRKDKSHSHFDSDNDTHDTDEKNQESKTIKDDREESRVKDKYNDYKKSNHKDHGKEKERVLVKDSSEIKSDEIKNKNSHASPSHHMDHKNRKNNDKEDEHRSNSGHKHNKEGTNNREENKDKNSFDHENSKEKKKDHKDIERDNPEDDQGKKESRKKYGKEHKSSKSKTTDTNGGKRNHVDHRKEHAGDKKRMKANKDENGGSSESTEASKKENLERKIGNKNGNKIQDKKLINKPQDNHEQQKIESSKQPAKHGEAKNTNNSYEDKDKGEPYESQKPKHRNRSRVTYKNGSRKIYLHEHSSLKKGQHKSSSHINVNAKSHPGVFENKNDKHNHEKNGKVVPSEIEDIMDSNERDKTNTGHPKHKQSLYHSLNELKEIKNTTDVETNDNTANSGHDIMQSNQNYTKSKNPKKTEEDGEKDKTKFFNQETREWKESFKGDQVDESGKYFNQRTRDWSVHQPKTNTGYFHNLTSQWNLKNKTKPSDFGKYFNQRTKTWLGHEVDKNSGDTLETTKAKMGNALKTNESMEGSKVKDTRKKITSKKGKQNMMISKPVLEHKIQPTIPQNKERTHSPSQLILNNTTVSKDLNHSKTSGTITPTKIKQNVTKVINAPHKVKDSESAEEKVKNEILKLIGEAPDKTTSQRKKTQNFNHRLIHQHQKPSVKVLTHIENISTKKPKNIPQPKRLLPSPKNRTKILPKHHMKPYESHTAGQNKIWINKFPHMRKKQKVLATSKLHTKMKKAFDANRPYEMKINSSPLKSKGKYRISSRRKQKLRPLLEHPETKPIRPAQPLAIPIKKHSKLHEIRNKPNNDIYHIKKTAPNINIWKGSSQKPFYTPTVSSIKKEDYQNWNKQNVFDNEWNNANWNSYFNTYGSNSVMQTPTVKPTLSWGNMAWNLNNNQETPHINEDGSVNRISQVNRPTTAPVNGNVRFPFSTNSKNRINGVGDTPGVLAPTLAPQYKQGGSNRNGEVDRRVGHNTLVPRPTFAPHYKLGEFPLPENSDRTNRMKGYWHQNVKNLLRRPESSVHNHQEGTTSNTGNSANEGKKFWNQNVKTPYEGQVPKVSTKPLPKTTPRRNHVYYSDKQNNQRISNLTQNNVLMQPRKQAAPKLKIPPTFVEPLGNVTSMIPITKAPNQPVPNRNNYLRQNKGN